MISEHNLYIIAAVDHNFGVGKNGDLAWRLKGDMAYFASRTTKTQDVHKQNMVIMGRTTWESIPEKYRPLRDRVNVVLTRQENYSADNAQVVHNIEDAYDLVDDSIESIYIIGGSRVYTDTITDERVDGVYLTHIDHEYDVDTYFPAVPEQFRVQHIIGSEQENGVVYHYILHTR